MNPTFNKNTFLIKEHLGIFKAANNYDIYDATNNQMIMKCTEPNLGFFTKMFRFTDYKRMTPFDVQIMTTEGKPLLSIKRGISVFRSDVEVLDDKNQLIGSFKQKFWSIGGKFELLDKNEKPLCTLQGKWTGWDFKFTKDNQELAHVSKKWAGIGKEFFTSADNYVLEINQSVAEDNPVRQMILAAVMCIDMVLKE